MTSFRGCMDVDKGREILGGQDSCIMCVHVDTSHSTLSMCRGIMCDEYLKV